MPPREPTLVRELRTLGFTDAEAELRTYLDHVDLGVPVCDKAGE